MEFRLEVHHTIERAKELLEYSECFIADRSSETDFLFDEYKERIQEMNQCIEDLEDLQYSLDEMFKLPKEKIKEDFESFFEKAWNSHGQETTYILEQLPRAIDSDCDEEVGNFITNLGSYIRTRNRRYYEMEIDDLIDYYYDTQVHYDL